MKRLYIIALVLGALAAYADDSKYLLFYSGGEEILRLGTSEVDSIVIVRKTVTPPRPDVPEGAVDLGLSVMWAQCNLGAERPGDFGGYYSFGAVEEQELYNTLTYHRAGHFSDASISGHPRYDAAYALLDGKWRMPTEDEYKELLEKCSFEIITDAESGNLCLRATGPSGNSIIFPGAGFQSDYGLAQVGYGWYYSSKAFMWDNHEEASCFNFTPDGLPPNTITSWGRANGMQIRPVYLGDEEIWHKPEVPVGNAVDLGLSVEWADFNVGASDPYESTHVYSFADIDERYSFSAHIYGDKPGDYLFDKDLSNPAYDVAAYLWGDGWRIPTAAEWQELIDNCTFEWQTADAAGCEGVKVTGPNGNSIFLSAEGYYDIYGQIYGGRDAMYMSSTPYTADRTNQLTRSFLFTTREDPSDTNPGIFDYNSYRTGLPVRPVRDKKASRSESAPANTVRPTFTLPAPSCPTRPI